MNRPNPSVFQGLDVKLIRGNSPSMSISGGSQSGGNSQGVDLRPKSIFEGLDVTPTGAVEQTGVGQQEDTWGNLAARTGKSAIAGVGGGVVDAATAVYNIPAALSNATEGLRQGNPFEVDPISGMPIQKPEGKQDHLPLIPSATDAIDEGIDHATGGYTRTPEQEKWFQEGIKFASAVATGGGLGALAGKAGRKGAETALKAVGSLRSSSIVGAGASGAAMQKAQERNISTPGSIGAGMGAGLAAEAAMNVLNPKNIARRATAVTGFGRNNLNIPAIDSAKHLNIDLPGIAATKGVTPAFAHQMTGKFPYFGDKLKEKIKVASEQYQKAWNDMLDGVGVPKTGEVSKNIDRSYDLMRSAIPEGAAATPAPILEAIANVEGKLKTTVHSEPTKKLFSVMGEFKKAFQPALPEGFEKLPQNIRGKILEALENDATPVPVKELVRQKVELNKIMKDRNIFDRHDTDSLAFLHELRDGVNKTLENYGATNPKFMKTLKRADERFAKTARREALDDVFAGKIVDPKTGEVSYNSLLSVLNDRKQQKFLRNNLGQTNYKKLEDFVNVAKAMESVKRNNPNPSGSASMGAAIGLVVSLCHGNLKIPAITIGGGTVATTLLTSKKFLNKATQFAKEPTEPLAKQLAAIVKENTGMTIQAIQKGMRDSRED